jgi:hypothetical protein
MEKLTGRCEGDAARGADTGGSVLVLRGVLLLREHIGVRVW